MSDTFRPASNPSIVQTQAARQQGRAHVLVIGNEKGGSASRRPRCILPWR